LDVTDASSIKKTVDEIIAKEEHLDVLINNAGCALCGPLECLAMKDIVAQMDVNFFGAIRTCQEVLPHMRRQKSGHIINISSEQGVYGLPYGSLYTASKAALESLSEALSLEVLPWNISVSIVEPGPVATNFSVNWGTRPLEHSPYQAICRKIEDSLQQKREPSEFCQSAIEIAHFIQKVIEDPKPQLRYQTSKKVEETVARSICDLSGADYTMRMKSLLIEAYKEAWSSD
jgi:retinol dehydrogenase-8